MYRPWTVCVLVLALAACHQDPTDPATQPGPPLAMPVLAVAPAEIPPLVCSKTFLTTQPGFSWHEAAAWTPAGVPTSADIVCVGAYVRVDSSKGPTWARSLEIGANGSLTSWELHVVDTVVVRAGGEIFTAHQLDVGKAIINYGCIVIADGTVSVIGNTDNYGLVVAASSFGATSPPSWSTDTFTMYAGEATSRSFSSLLAIRAGAVRWKGGLGFGIVMSGGHARLEGGTFIDAAFSGEVLELASVQVQGELGVPYADSIIGDIGRYLELEIGGGFPSTYTFRATRGGPLTPVTSEGTITVRSSPLGGVTLDLPGDLVNDGEILVEGEATVTGGTLVNRDRIDLEADLTVETGIENRGTIALGSLIDLDMAPGSVFDARSGSEVTGGQVWLQAARVVGTGFIHNVESVAGTIQPGDPYGTLFLENLDLDALSVVSINMVDTTAGKYSQLASGGVVTLNGTLELITKLPFEGGKCGHMIPALTNTFLTDGEFQTISGLAQAPQRAWRVHSRGDTLWVAGYRPWNGLTIDGTVLAIEEGGATSSYSICMGTTRPTAPVTVDRYNVLGQLIPTPGVIFDPADWALPRKVYAIAIDDAVVEGLHSDTITHVVTTTDPTYAGTTLAARAVTIMDNDTAADLTLIRVSQQDNRFVGDTMATVFRVSNTGPSASTGSRVVSLPLTGLEYVSATGAACVVLGTGSLRCTLGAIAAGSQADFTVIFRAVVAGLHVNTLTVTGQQLDPDAANNTVIYTQRVN